MHPSLFTLPCAVPGQAIVAVELHSRVLCIHVRYRALATAFLPQWRAIIHFSSSHMAPHMRRFSEPTFRPPDPQIIGFKGCLKTCLTRFAHLHFLSSNSAFCSLLLLSLLPLCCAFDLHISRNLASKVLFIKTNAIHPWAQGQPLRCPSRIFCVHQPSAVLSGGGWLCCGGAAVKM